MEGDFLAAEGPDGLAVLGHVRDDEDFLDGAVRLRPHVRNRSSEILGEADQVLLADLLAAKKQHAVIEKGAAQHTYGLPVQFTAQIQATHFSAECATGRYDFKRIHHASYTRIPRPTLILRNGHDADA